MKTILTLILLFCAVFADAVSITVVWDPPTSTNVIVGYRVFYRTSTNLAYGPFQITSGLQHTITNLVAGTNYFIVVAAVDSSGLQSVYSEQVESTTPTPNVPNPPTNLRVITNSLQSSLSTDGPWMTVASSIYDVPTNESKFYRTRLDWGIK